MLDLHAVRTVIILISSIRILHENKLFCNRQLLLHLLLLILLVAIV
jgi:hypothetical protein